MHTDAVAIRVDFGLPGLDCIERDPLAFGSELVYSAYHTLQNGCEIRFKEGWNNRVVETQIAKTKAEEEYATVLEHAGWADLEVGLIRVAGRERVRWLHKIITADVEHLEVGQGTHAALLDAKGHFVAELTALVEQESVLLLTEPSATVLLLNGLRRYIIREKVELNDESGDWGLFALVGKDCDALATQLFDQCAPNSPYSFASVVFGEVEVRLIRNLRARLPVTDILVPSPASERVRGALISIPELGDEVLQVMRIEAGMPRWGIDFDSSTLALEIPDVHSVRVDQGCYVGQEVVARLVHRGHVNRMLVGLRFEGDELPTRGAVILGDGKEVGAITSAAISPKFGMIGLGYVRREASEIGTSLRLPSHVNAQVAKIPFEE